MRKSILITITVFAISLNNMAINIYKRPVHYHINPTSKIRDSKSLPKFKLHVAQGSGYWKMITDTRLAKRQTPCNREENFNKNAAPRRHAITIILLEPVGPVLFRK